MEKKKDKILNYRIISAECSNDLEERVNKYMRKGYKICGGVMAYRDLANTMTHFFQAMSK